MTYRSIFRIVLDILVFVCLIESFWPAALLFVVIGLIFFDDYFEIIIFGLVADGLFGLMRIGQISFLIFTYSFAGLLILATLFRKVVRK